MSAQLATTTTLLDPGVGGERLTGSTEPGREPGPVAPKAAPSHGIARRYHHFGRLELVALFLSYQRYACLLAGLSLAAIGGGLYLGLTQAWYWAIVPAAIGLKIGSFAVAVAMRLPEKMRITGVAQRRIDAGRFEPAMVRDFCGDPCFRVMAKEVLRRSRLPAAQRKQLIEQYTLAAKEEAGQTLIIDHTRGEVFKVEGDQLILVNNTPTVSEQESTK